MASKLFELVEQFMMDTFLLKLTQFEKTGSIGINFLSLGNLITNFHFQNWEPIAFAFLLTMESNELKKSQFKSRKIKIERKQILRPFPEKKTKKISKTYIRVFTNFITLNKTRIAGSDHRLKNTTIFFSN